MWILYSILYTILPIFPPGKLGIIVYSIPYCIHSGPCRAGPALSIGKLGIVTLTKRRIISPGLVGNPRGPLSTFRIRKVGNRPGVVHIPNRIGRNATGSQAARLPGCQAGSYISARARDITPCVNLSTTVGWQVGSTGHAVRYRNRKETDKWDERSQSRRK